MRRVLDHIHIFTRDPDATAHWFALHFRGDVLRYKQSDGRLRIDVRFGEVFFYLSHPPAPGAVADSDPVRPPTGINHIGFSVDDVDDAVEHLRGSGVRVLQEPKTPRPGVRNAYVEGPEGIRIEIFRRDAIDYGQV